MIVPYENRLRLCSNIFVGCLLFSLLSTPQSLHSRIWQGVIISSSCAILILMILILTFFFTTFLERSHRTELSGSQRLFYFLSANLCFCIPKFGIFSVRWANVIAPIFPMTLSCQPNFKLWRSHPQTQHRVILHLLIRVRRHARLFARNFLKDSQIQLQEQREQRQRKLRGQDKGCCGELKYSPFPSLPFPSLPFLSFTPLTP